MEISSEDLASLDRKVAAGQASGQEKVIFAAGAGERNARDFLPAIRGLFLDPDPEVRKYALQAVVFDFDVNDAEMLGFCRRRLAEDEDEYVRSMAATCIGNLRWDSRDAELFGFLEGRLEDENEERLVRGAVYNALLAVMGVHPKDGWFGANFRDRAVFDPNRHIDREKLALLKAELKEPSSP